MNATRYRVTMSDKSVHDFVKSSAGEAIESALRANPGSTVTDCYAGLTEKQANDLRTLGIDKQARAGVVKFEIPAHRALTEAEASAPIRPRKPKDPGTVSMFEESAMATGRLAP